MGEAMVEPGDVFASRFGVVVTEAIEVDKFELEEASWFTKDAVRKSLAGDYEGAKLIVPPPMAIAHHLLRRWVDE